jgi:hypothetical protein
VVVVPAVNIDIAAVGDTTDDSAGVWINCAGVWTNRDRRRRCRCDGEKGACGCAAEFFDVRDSDSCINTATREQAKQDFTEPVT